jgi:hypothetical protein
MCPVLIQCEVISFAEKIIEMKQIAVLVLLISPFTSKAQGWANDSRFTTGTWNTVNVRYEAFPKLHFIAEGQIRSQKFYNDLNYWELKTFFQYIFTDQFSGGLGAGTYHQYVDYENFRTPQKQTENRIWAEFQLKSNGKRIQFDHRYRFEYRFIQKWNGAIDGFTSNYDGSTDEDRFRFRYRLQAFIPINHKKMEPKTFFANVSNEVLFTHKLPYLNQNRFFVGFGYKMQHGSIQIGVLHQFLKLTGTERRKDYLQITYAHVFKRTPRPKQEKI